MSGGVFISYRLEDYGPFAERIFERLRSSLGRDRVTLLHMALISRDMTERVGKSDAVVVLIGETWFTKTFDDPNEPVRLSIEAALFRKVRVIPVLVHGASMPQAATLPESLQGLARLRPIELSYERFDPGMEQLEETLRNRPINLSGAPPIKLPLPIDLSNPTVEGVERSAPPWTAGRVATATGSAPRRRSSTDGAKKKAAKKAAAKTPTRKNVTKKAVPKGAANKTAAKKPAAKKAARPAPAERHAAPGKPRGAANQDLSVDEMKRFASARRGEAPPAADHRPARSQNPQSADSAEEVVECSVFGPPAAPPGATILIRVFLHLANQAERAGFLATTMDSSAKLKGTRSLDLPIKRGARVEIAFSANGLEVDDPVQSVVWRGEPTYSQFLATVPSDTSGQGFFPVVRVSVDGKLLGAIKFRLSSDATASQPTSEPLGDHAGPYKYAFVSYASKDRKEVLKRVQMLEVLRTKFFQDILSLDPGDRWEKKLYENIVRCDLFLLFWSVAAKESRWVIKEAEYALGHQQKNPQSEPDLVPVVLEQNVLPPPSLSAFHFNDRISYLTSLVPYTKTR